MCLDFEMIVMLFLVWIVAPMLFIGVLIFAVVEIVENRRIK